MKRIFTGIVYLACILLLASCASPYKKDSAPTKTKPTTRVDRAEKVVPRAEPKSKYGNPPSYVVFGKRYYVLPSSTDYLEQGIASWYGTKFHGRRTSSGETYDMYAMTAAHKTLPLPTYARVTNKRNGRSIIVRINDRGPFHENRIIDLSYAAATKLGIVTRGTGLVEVRAIDPRRSSGSTGGTRKEIVDLAESELETASTAEAVAEKPIGIFVQIGAFRSQANAQKLRAQFATLNVGQVGVQAFQLEDTPIYKVRIGPLKNVGHADETVAKLAKLGHKDYKLVFEDQPTTQQ